MSKRTLWISIESITLLQNGDVPGQTAPQGDNKRNAVMASLTYPRSGAPTVTSGQQYNVPQDAPFQPDQTNFFISGLFKEDVDTATMLEIKVTDTDFASKAEKIFVAILGALVNAGLTAAAGGLTGFLGAIAGAGIGQIKTGMSGLGGDQVYVVGATDKIALNMDDLPSDKATPLRMGLGLVVPDDIDKPYFVLDPETGNPVERHLLIPKGTPNGEIILLLAAVPE